tara:strand:+ start:914 stop:1639 length:726 start_codon:yes stop_codon:yes gene_type:complete
MVNLCIKRLSIILAFFFVFIGCAVSPDLINSIDPYEEQNRKVHEFNERIIENLIEPVTGAYVEATPPFVRERVTDFFENIDDVKSGLNNVMQENFSKALNDFGRFVFNSTFGIFGLFDVATPMGFSKNNEDFGQTLGKWGVEPGPYIVLPFLGPTTVRDGLSRGLDSVISPLAVADDHPAASGLLTGLNILNQTTVLLELDNFISGDKYIFFRDAYLQRRKYEISDGEINPDDFVDEFEDF